MGGVTAIERIDTGGTSLTTYTFGDHLSSATMTVTAAGETVANVRYQPFGEERWSEVDMPTDRGYTNQRNEQGMGLMDYNARYYSPYLNRFLSPDVIVPDPYNSLDWDRYSYARNNPVRYSDPSGHRPCSDDPNFSECEKGLPHALKNNQEDPVKLDTYYPAADIRSLYIKYKYTKGWWNDDGYGSAYFTELHFLKLMLSYEFSTLPTTAAFAEKYTGTLKDLSHGTSHWFNSRCELFSGGACSGVSPNAIFNFLAASQSMLGRMNAIFSGKASLGL